MFERKSIKRKGRLEKGGNFEKKKLPRNKRLVKHNYRNGGENMCQKTQRGSLFQRFYIERVF